MALQSNKTSPTIRSISIFAMHQFVGTFGVVWLSTLLASFAGHVLTILFGIFGHSFSMRPLYWIMTETPFFPVQVVMGLCWGWALYRRWRHRSMLWIWVLPVLILGYEIMDLSTSHAAASVFDQAMGLRPALSHYLGWGCSIRSRCFDQIIVTLPTYAACAYACGAALTRAWLLRGLKA